MPGERLQQFQVFNYGAGRHPDDVLFQMDTPAFASCKYACDCQPLQDAHQRVDVETPLLPVCQSARHIDFDTFLPL
jgi:hypothetical protein